MQAVETYLANIMETTRRRYNAQVNYSTGKTTIKGVAEFYTSKGQQLTIALTAYQTKIEARVYNHNQRIIYSDVLIGEGIKIENLFSFIGRYTTNH